MSQIAAKGTEFAGQAIVQVEQKDDKGQGMGVYVDKLVKDLKPEDVENLAQQQLDSSMSMEDIAHSQLDQLKQLNSNINEVVGTIKYGTAGSKTFQDAYKGSIKAIDEGIMKKIDDLYKSMGIEKGLKPEEVGAGIDIITSKVGDVFEMGYKKVIEITDEYLGGFLKTIKGAFGVGGGDPSELVNNTQTASTSVLSQSPNETVVNALNNTTINNNTNNTPLKLEISHTFDFTNLPSNVNTEDVKQIVTTSIKDWSSNPINANAFAKLAKNINAGLKSI
jgi:hypothetical protein